MAADPRTIMRALKAVAPAPSMGGYGNNPAPYIGPGPSPLVASYNESYGAHQYGTNSALPRDWQTFLSGMFGPLAPIQPVPIDMPEPGEERPFPRREEYPIGWNLPMGMPGTEGWGKLADFNTLRTLADLYSVARQCIELRKSEIRGIGWDIGPTRHAAKAMRGDHKAAADIAERQAKAVRFFRKPDPDYADLSSWMNAILEDFFVTDALAVFPHPSRASHGGLFGSGIAGLDLIDGSLVKPLVDIRGGKPQPPNPCYAQYEYGVPRVDLMTLITESTENGDKLLREYGGDQLLYLPYTRRSWTVYGQSFVERAIVPITTGIHKQSYQSQYYTEGSIPGLFLSPGDSSLTPSQIRELQDSINALSSDQAWKHKIIVTPSGSRIDPMRPWPLADDFDTLIMIQTCMSFDVQPFELGILPQLSAAAASSGTARQTVGARLDVRQRKSTVPLLLYLKAAIFDRILQDVCGQHDLEFKFEGLDEDEDVAELTQALVEQIGAGLLSIDEGRQLLGRDPWGLPITSDPGWATQWGGLVPLTGVTEATAQPLGGSPGPGGPGRAAARPGGSPGAVDLTTPGSVSGPGAPPPTVPRNRMSSSQRHAQAAHVTATQNNTGSRGTPAHSGARSAGGLGPVAARSPKVQAQQRQQARKAIEAGLAAKTIGEFEEAAGVPLLEAQRHAIAGQVLSRRDERPPGDPLRELGLLKSHLKRGGTVGQWAPRDLPGAVLAMIDQDMAAGLSVDYACSEARKGLLAAAGGTTLDGSGESFTVCGQGHKHWGAHGAAGLLIRAKGGDGKWRYLLQRRGDTSDHAGTWGIPGGALHEGELPLMGAMREATEELGILPNLRPHHTVVDDHGPGPDGASWAYHTIVTDAPAVFQPHVDGATSHETAGWAWMTARQVEDHPLHPGFERSWRQVRLSRRNKAVKDASNLADPNPVDPEHILSVMRDKFPEKALSWVPKCKWIGPIEIPHDRIDYDDADSWRASREPGDVKDYADKIEDGDEVAPTIMVQPHDEDKVIAVDGHHRILAYRKLKRPVKAYVGFAPGGKVLRTALETHSSQYNGAAGKSAETPIVSTVHHPLGRSGLWHTPDKHVSHAQQLPAYVQSTARALMRDHGMEESEAIATAINAIRAWAAGHAFGGKVKTTPEVQQAARRALREWAELKESHH